MFEYLTNLIKKQTNQEFSVVRDFVFEYLNQINKNILLINNSKNIQNVNLNKILEKAIQNQISFITIIKDHDIKKITRLGDMHNGGKCTCLIETDNEKYIYKPINPAPMLLLNKILSSFNKTGLFDFYLLSISKISQGIKVKYLSNSICEDINKFSYHYGALLFITTLLRGIDFHEENVFCVESIPVIIDCESLFYPVIKDTKPYNSTATLLFPTKFNLSYKHLKKGIISAFKATKILQNFLIKEIDSNIFDLNIRLIFKPTKYYYGVLSNSTHPGLLLNNNERRMYIQKCLSGKRSISQSIFSSELEDLVNLDVPFFYFKRDELFNSRDAVVPQDFLSSSKLEIKNNFENLEWFTNNLLSYVSEK